MKHLLQYLTVFFLFLGAVNYAQEPGLDSLKQVLENLEEDTTRVNTLNDIAYILYRMSPDEAIEYSQEAESLAEKLGFTEGLAQAYKTLGWEHICRAPTQMPSGSGNWPWRSMSNPAMI